MGIAIFEIVDKMYYIEIEVEEGSNEIIRVILDNENYYLQHENGKLHEIFAYKTKIGTDLELVIGEDTYLVSLIDTMLSDSKEAEVGTSIDFMDNLYTIVGIKGNVLKLEIIPTRTYEKEIAEIKSYPHRSDKIRMVIGYIIIALMLFVIAYAIIQGLDK